MDYLSTLPLTHAKYFRPADFMLLLSKLKENPDDAMKLASLPFKDPTVVLALSIFVGLLGVDRMYRGQVMLGILKLATCGGFLIWWIIDMITVMDDVRRENGELVIRMLYASIPNTGTTTLTAEDNHSAVKAKIEWQSRLKQRDPKKPLYLP